MPLDGLTSGIDATLTLSDSTGILLFTLLESFTSREDATVDKLIQINGQVRHPKFHQGWSGTFMWQRNSAVLDSYIAQQEVRYYEKHDQINATINLLLTESNGTISQWQYRDCVFSLEDAGNYSGTEIVKQTLSFMAATKVQLA